jgi:hypothetical protein
MGIETPRIYKPHVFGSISFSDCERGESCSSAMLEFFEKPRSSRDVLLALESFLGNRNELRRLATKRAKIDRSLSPDLLTST